MIVRSSLQIDQEQLNIEDIPEREKHNSVKLILLYDSFLRDMQWLERINEHTAKVSEVIEKLSEIIGLESLQMILSQSFCFVESIVLMMSNKLTNGNKERRELVI